MSTFYHEIMAPAELDAQAYRISRSGIHTPDRTYITRLCIYTRVRVHRLRLPVQKRNEGTSLGIRRDSVINERGNREANELVKTSFFFFHDQFSHALIYRQGNRALTTVPPLLVIGRPGKEHRKWLLLCATRGYELWVAGRNWRTFVVPVLHVSVPSASLLR